MAQFPVPASKKKYTLTLQNFLGIDKTTNMPNLRRAANSNNIIDDFGLHRKRDGFEPVYYHDPATNAPFDLNDMIEIASSYRLLDAFEYQIGKVLFVEIQYVDGYRMLRFTKANGFDKSGATLLYSTYVQDLTTFGIKKQKLGSKWFIWITRGESTTQFSYIFDGTTVTNLISEAYTPTTVIGKNPDGTGGEVLEDVNLISNFRKESFYGVAGIVNYSLTLGATFSMTDDEVSVEILQSDGSWSTKVEGVDFTVNRNTAVITFNVAPGVSPITGVDNIKIKYACAEFATFAWADVIEIINDGGNSIINFDNITGNLTDTLFPGDKVAVIHGGIWDRSEILGVGGVSIVVKGTVSTTFDMVLFDYDTFKHKAPANTVMYGYQSNDRIFLNLYNSNIDYYSAPNDGTYWPSSNFSVIGSESPIKGYIILNDRLVTFKDDVNSVWVRTGALVNSVEVFPGAALAPQERIIQVTQLNNRCVVLTSNGIYEPVMSGDNLLLLKRSLYIDYVFENNQNMTYSITIFKDKLYLKEQPYTFNLPEAITYNMYIAEMNITSRQPYENDYQWEWYPCNGIPEGNLFIDSLQQNLYMRNALYIVKFIDNLKYDSFPIFAANINYPEFMYYETYIFKRNINSYWETPFMNMNYLSIAKTIRNLYLNTRNVIGDKFEFGYILPDGTTEIIKKITETNNGGFPNLLTEKEKIKKFMWIKFYIKSIDSDDYYRLKADSYYQLFEDSKDLVDGSTSTDTDITYDNGAIFNATTSQIVLNKNLQLVDNSMLHLKLNINATHTTDAYIIDNTYNDGGTIKGYYLKLTKPFPTYYRLSFGVNSDLINYNFALEDLQQDITIRYNNGTVYLYTNNILRGQTNVTLSYHPSQVTILGKFYDGKLSYLILSTDTLLHEDTMFYQSMNYIFDSYPKIIYRNLLPKLIKSGTGLSFDRLDIEWQVAGKYRGD